MTWDSDTLDHLARAQELQITSRRSDGTLRRWTPIWVVRVDDDLYVRSAFGAAGGWYRNALRTGTARVRAGGTETDVTLTPVSDGELNTRVGAAYEAKYHGQTTGLEPMISPTADATTVRIDAS